MKTAGRRWGIASWLDGRSSVNIVCLDLRPGPAGSILKSHSNYLVGPTGGIP